MKVPEAFGISTHEKFTVENGPLYMGIECEIENIIDHSDINPVVFNTTTDGSLRNNGFEYVSVPLSVPVVKRAFEHLHAKLAVGPEPFTHRTSIHVHVNCANLDDTQVRSIVLLYALYEEAFFMMVDKSRRENIHCVALTETFLPSYYQAQLKGMFSKWHKYTALNLRPLNKYGTIEFRHMHGTSDQVLVGQWLDVLEALFAIGKEIKVDEVELTEEFLHNTFHKLFRGTALAPEWVQIRPKMDNQIIDIKLIG